jgi:hypothetical protein
MWRYNKWNRLDGSSHLAQNPYLTTDSGSLETNRRQSRVAQIAFNCRALITFAIAAIMSFHLEILLIASLSG